MHRRIETATTRLTAWLVCLACVPGTQGCGKDSRTVYTAPNEVVVSVKEDFNNPDRHVLSTQNSLLTTLEVVSLAPDVIIHEMHFSTSLPLERMRVASSSGFRAQHDFTPFNSFNFRLIGTDGGQIERLTGVQERRDILIYADTSDYKETPLRLTLTGMVISSSANPSLHTIPTGYIDLTVNLDAAPFIAVQAVDELKDYRTQGRGNADVLAEFIISEVSGEAAADLIQVYARLLTPGVTDISLVNLTGSSVADTEVSGFFNTDVTFQFLTPLRLQPGGSQRLRIIGNLTNAPSVDVVALEVRSLEFLSERKQAFTVDGPEDANGQPVTFIVVYN